MAINMSDPSIQAFLNSLQNNTINQAQNLAGGMPWSTLMGSVITDPSQQLVPGTPTLPATEAVGYVNINGQQVPTLQNLGQYANYVGTYGPGGPQTLASLLQQANLTGMYNNSPTFASQQATGYVNGSPTTTEQGILSGVINNMLQANNSPANPFTYLSRLQNINNIGPVASFLRGAMTGATGQTPQQLAQQPVVTNLQAAPSLFAGALGNASGQNPSTGSNPFTSILQNALSQNTGSGTQTAQLPYNGNSPVYPGGSPGGPIYSMNPSQQTANIAAAASGQTQGQSQPTSAMQSQLPTGWGTSLQQFSNLNSPSLQGAYMDAIANAGGQNQQDFMAGMNAAAPKFQRAASGSISNMGNL